MKTDEIESNGGEIRSNEEGRRTTVRDSPLIYGRKATFRNQMANVASQQGRGTGVSTSNEAMANSREGMSKAAYREHDKSQKEKGSFDEGSGHSPDVFPGAVMVSGPQIMASDRQGDDLDEEDQCPEPENILLVDNLNSLSPFPVEAHVVPEIDDVDGIVNRRVSQELQERLQVVARAEVIVPIQEKRACTFHTTKCRFGIASVTLLVAIVVGVSVGIFFSRSSTGTHVSRPTASPTILSRASFITNALDAELDGVQAWAVPATPQYEAFQWLSNIDTFDIFGLTSRQIFERYALTTLFYCIQQLCNGCNPLPFFLKPVSVCQWSMEDTSGNLTGVTGCVSGNLVSEIRLGKFSYASGIVSTASS